MIFESGIFEFSLLILLKTSLVVFIAAGWTHLLERSRAASRHAVWATALIVVILLPFLSLSKAKFWIPIPSQFLSATASGSASDSISESNPQASVLEVDASVSSSAPERLLDGPLPSDSGAKNEARDRSPLSITFEKLLKLVGSSEGQLAVLSLYLVGMIGLLFKNAAGVRRTAIVRKTGTPVATHPMWAQSFRELQIEFPGLHVLPGLENSRRVTALTSPQVTSPVTSGVLRPVVLLPQDVSTWSASQRRDALVHELSHVARFDWGFQVVALLACALHWFNPLVWRAARALQLEAERACDERVIELGGNPYDYAEQLVSLTRECEGHNLRPALAMANTTCLGSRIRALLSPRRTEMRSKLVLTTSAVLFTAASISLAPLQPVSADSNRFSKNDPPLPSLMQASRDGDASEVQRLLESGTDPNQQRGGRGTALILAATHGHAKVVSLLIGAGADVNRSERTPKRDLMRTPLTAAARNGHPVVVETLLDHAAHIDAAPRGDATALMEAAKAGHEQIVTLLIERGADVNISIDGDGNAIIAAAHGGDVAIAKRLVDAGANVNRGVPGDGNALIVAVQQSDQGMIHYLLSVGADPTAEVSGDESAMIIAAESGDTGLMRLLLDAVED